MGGGKKGGKEMGKIYAKLNLNTSKAHSFSSDKKQKTTIILRSVSSVLCVYFNQKKTRKFSLQYFKSSKFGHRFTVVVVVC